MLGTPGDPPREDGRRAWPMVAALAIIVVAWLGFWLYAHPGYMSYDSAWQLREARAGSYTDWHPPIMAAIWRQVDRVISGPFGMLVLQSGCFVAGVWLILQRRMPPVAAALGVLVVLWWPPIAATLAVIWKDSQMLGLAALGCALIESPRRAARIAGLAVLALASAMRINAFSITLPIIGLLFVWRPRDAGWRRYAIAAGAWLLITVAAMAGNAQLTDRQSHPWHGSVALFDIVGTLHFSGPLTDAELHAALDGAPGVPAGPLQDRLQRCYSPATAIFAVLNGGCLTQPGNDDERAAVERTWRAVVTAHPAAYLVHRWRAFETVLRINPASSQIWVGFDFMVKHEDRGQPSPLQRTLAEAMTAISHGWTFRPVVYLAVLLLLSPWWWRTRLTCGLAVSALLSEALLFLATPAPDFRYSIWLVFVTMLLVVMSGYTAVRKARMARA